LNRDAPVDQRERYPEIPTMRARAFGNVIRRRRAGEISMTLVTSQVF
jgi:hypothetical protein